MFWKTIISYTLIRTPTRVYQGLRNVSFSENLACVLNEWSLSYCGDRSSFLVYKKIEAKSLLFRTLLCFLYYISLLWRHIGQVSRKNGNFSIGPQEFPRRNVINSFHLCCNLSIALVKLRLNWWRENNDCFL